MVQPTFRVITAPYPHYGGNSFSPFQLSPKVLQGEQDTVLALRDFTAQNGDSWSSVLFYKYLFLTRYSSTFLTCKSWHDICLYVGSSKRCGSYLRGPQLPDLVILFLGKFAKRHQQWPRRASPRVQKWKSWRRWQTGESWTYVQICLGERFPDTEQNCRGKAMWQSAVSISSVC